MKELKKIEYNIFKQYWKINLKNKCCFFWGICEKDIAQIVQQA
jgi:hypothetical protein